MQALRPLRHNDTGGLQLSTWLRSPCPGRTPRRPDLRRQRTPSCHSHAACPSPVLRPTPRHRSSITGHRDDWPSLRGSTLQEPSARVSCSLRRVLTGFTAGCFSPDLPTPLPWHSSCPAARVVQQEPCLKDTSLKYCILLCQHWVVTSGRRPSR